MNLGVVRDDGRRVFGSIGEMWWCRVPIEMTMANHKSSSASARRRSALPGSITWSLQPVFSFGRRMTAIVCRYLPIGGLKEFCQLSIDLAYGADSHSVKEKRIASVQTLSGTGNRLNRDGNV